ESDPVPDRPKTARVFLATRHIDYFHRSGLAVHNDDQRKKQGTVSIDIEESAFLPSDKTVHIADDVQAVLHSTALQKVSPVFWQSSAASNGTGKSDRLL